MRIGRHHGALPTTHRATNAATAATAATAAAAAAATTTVARRHEHLHGPTLGGSVAYGAAPRALLRGAQRVQHTEREGAHGGRRMLDGHRLQRGGTRLGDGRVARQLAQHRHRLRREGGVGGTAVHRAPHALEQRPPPQHARAARLRHVDVEVRLAPIAPIAATDADAAAAADAAWGELAAERLDAHLVTAVVAAHGKVDGAARLHLRREREGRRHVDALAARTGHADA